jgi:hypothetical protein
LAIKKKGAAVSADFEILTRFQHEARTVACLL